MMINEMMMSTSSCTTNTSNDNKNTAVKTDLFNTKKHVIFVGRIKQNLCYISSGEYARRVYEIDSIDNRSKSNGSSSSNNYDDNYAIFTSMSTSYMKENRKDRNRKLKHLIPNSKKQQVIGNTAPATSSSNLLLQSVTTNIKTNRCYLLLSNLNMERFSESNFEGVPLTQQLATLLLHQQGSLENKVRLLRYRLEVSSEKLQQHTKTPMIKLTGWSIISQNTLLKVVGWLRIVNKQSIFQKNFFTRSCKSMYEIKQVKEKKKPTQNEEILRQKKLVEIQATLFNLEKEEEEINEQIKKSSKRKNQLIKQLEKLLYSKDVAEKKLDQLRIYDEHNIKNSKQEDEIKQKITQLRKDNQRLKDILQHQKQEMSNSASLSMNKINNPNPQQPNFNINLKQELEELKKELATKQKREQELQSKCHDMKQEINNVKNDEMALFTNLDRLKRKSAKRIFVANKISAGSSH